MQRQTLISSRGLLNFAKAPNGEFDLGFTSLHHNFLPNRINFKAWVVRLTRPSIVLNLTLGDQKLYKKFHSPEIKSSPSNISEELLDEDEDLCPVECVREFKTDAEFFKVLEKAKETNTLVVVDFYRTSCGSCKYIAQGFAKLCKGSGSQNAPVIFLKHNVMDEYDEQTDVAERLRIKTVPLFHFYKNGVLLEAFPTRDKARIDAAILKYNSTSEEI